MPSPSSRWHRALAAVAALPAVLVGALLCVGTSTAADTGGTAGAGRPRPAVAGPAAVAPQAAVSPNGAVAPPAAVAEPGAAPAGEQRAPGCGEGSGDGGLSPATPPRGSAAHELLPALPTTAHGGAGCPAAGDALLDLAPERAPPALAAPGPIDLSVLRV
ncbi:hypothetical protein QMZ92_20955 [Streptomyces sp. HNM0645]|uniref:hypothetical protein n=1 Tax=Streptomyces sp. HNM0645 TaxID=2782343 RepID=UPI0024B81978|nr:hypothetical protein [Streptomyces sp. HNM0645]MDI9886775.1 hypothetical protein [Streptomyces sp. HNM0645]